MKERSWRSWRSWEEMQSFALPASNRYCSDELTVYNELWWPSAPDGGKSSYLISHGKLMAKMKHETYTIEGVNADLRTYLGRLKRKSRCFSVSLATQGYAGQCACSCGTTIYNRRQRAILAYPCQPTPQK